jgi:putative restriction endonuclease
MKKGQKLWTREELILAINLYCKIPFGRLHQRNPMIIELAKSIGRTPSSVTYKLVNFASLDPSLKERGIKGAQNTSKLDKEIWSEFYANWSDLSYESESLLAKINDSTIEKENFINEEELPRDGKIREQMVKVRVNQSFFRKAILASYNNTCCITGIQNPDLLIAGHIKPWALDEKNRLNPRNGIAINPLHDKAYECGLISISPDYKIKISSEIKKMKSQLGIDDYFLKYENKEIFLPNRFLPDKKFLEYHYYERFKQ